MANNKKDIDAVIDGLISALESLKKRHNEHIKMHTNSFHKHFELLRKFVHGDQLDPKEYTGDLFHKMLAYSQTVNDMKTPYRVDSQQLLVELRKVQSSIKSLLSDLESLWSKEGVHTDFRFSEQLKFKDILLVESSTRMKTTGTELGLALLEPQLSSTAPSRITLRMNGIGLLGIGICFANVVAQRGYLFDCNNFLDLDSIKDHGTYRLTKNANIWSHCNKEQDGQELGFKFKVEESVTI